MAPDGFHPGEPVYRATGEALAPPHRTTPDHTETGSCDAGQDPSSPAPRAASAGRGAARDGANIVIAAKTAETNPKPAPFTGGRDRGGPAASALALQTDIRDEANVLAAVEQAVARFGSTSWSTTPARSA